MSKLEGITPEFTDDAINEIVTRTMKYNTGTRVLRSIMEKHMLNIMFDIPNLIRINKCTITKEVITKDILPTYVERRKQGAQ